MHHHTAILYFLMTKAKLCLVRFSFIFNFYLFSRISLSKHCYFSLSLAYKNPVQNLELNLHRRHSSLVICLLQFFLYFRLTLNSPCTWKHGWTLHPPVCNSCVGLQTCYTSYTCKLIFKHTAEMTQVIFLKIIITKEIYPLISCHLFLFWLR